MSGPNSYLSEPTAEYAEYLRVTNPIPDLADIGGSEQARQALQNLFNPSRNVTIPTTGFIITDFTIPARDGYSLPIRSYIPEGPENTTWPVIIWSHYGGWVFGGLESDDTLCRVFAKELKVAVVNIDYRLAPKWVFPTAVNDVHDTVRWVSANPDKLNADLTKGFIIGGTSAGANMSSIVAHLARDENLTPPLTGQLLSQGNFFSRGHLDFIPEELRAEYTSDIDNKDAVIISAKSMEYIFNTVKPDPTSPLFSPVLFKSHKGLPKAFFEVAGGDPLRDDGLIYAKILQASGVETRMKIFPGLPHTFYEFSQWKAAGEWIPSLVEGGKYLLGRA
ncbi:hypothetical protein P167DRAFT_532246 [Morchella conica CCBAS932]|uniref:Alpha/beta hydrolase fold-3 domain-containing protein n=1 Tax=Morchella conica CCBAS932 TaxID=1392247 RepID=A0A3N4L7T1_9PEZI|nr:hypothetical protein P167DRAFT_532246 [Morchella conica CCBAS932]